VYGDARGRSDEEIHLAWEETKRKEKGKRERESILDGVPPTLPALLRARRLQQKAANVGFDWPDLPPVVKKIEEELAELKEALRSSSSERTTCEIGDLLFSVVNLCRFVDVDPEAALNGTIRRFRDRFRAIEGKIDPEAPPPLEILDRYWEEAKGEE
jgi:tetrapyrrole methylase family protein/MazG family protein